MTLTSRALGTALAASLTVSGAVLVSSGPAQAGGDSYGTVFKVGEAKLKACKVSIRGGRKFRVNGYLDNTAGERSDDVYAKVTVQKNGKNTSESFKTPYIDGGEKSKVYSLVVPNRKAFGLETVGAGRQYGGGGTLTLESVKTC